MNKQPMFLSLLLISLYKLLITASSASCPLDLCYVSTFPWNTTTCRDPIDTNQCCQTLHTLFAIGLAQNLKATSLFRFPDEPTSSACLSDFKLKLSSLKIQPSLVPTCFNDSTEFVTNSSNCAGIKNITDWKDKVGLFSPLDTSCNGDLKNQTRCSVCLDAGSKVASQLNAIQPNSTKCFYYTLLYASAIANQFGPTDVNTAGCILGVPLSI